MTFTPDRVWGKAGLAALSLGLISSLGLPAAAAQGDSELAAAREALARGNGIAAEVALERALDAGAARAQIAALMGEAEFQQGDFGAARKWLEPQAFSDEERVHGFHMLARLEMAEGNLAAAGQAFKNAVEGNDGTAEIWVNIGRWRYQGGEHHQALEASIKALRLDPEHPRALEFRGQLVRDAEGLIAALPWFERGLKSAPDDLSLLGEYAATLGEIGRAKDMLRITRQMITLDGSNARAFYLQAVLAARAGKFNLARRLLSRTGQNYENVPAAIMLTGILEVHTGNYALAVEAFADLARSQPENGRVQQLFARALLENGEAREVVARFGPATNRVDASPYLLTLVGRAYEILGDRAAAAPFLDRAALPPKHVIISLANSEQGKMAIFRWGDDPFRLDAAIPKVRMFLGQGRLDEATKITNMLSERYNGSVDVQTLAGDVALARSDPAMALDNYQTAAKIRRSFPLIERMVAAFELAGQHGSAQALCDEYLYQHPQDGDAAALCATLAAQNGEWKRARALFAYAIKLGGGEGTPQLRASLALAELQTGDVEGAITRARSAYLAQRSNGRAAYIYALALRQGKGREAEAQTLMAKVQRLGTITQPFS